MNDYYGHGWVREAKQIIKMLKLGQDWQSQRRNEWSEISHCHADEGFSGRWKGGHTEMLAGGVCRRERKK